MDGIANHFPLQDFAYTIPNFFGVIPRSPQKRRRCLDPGTNLFLARRRSHCSCFTKQPPNIVQKATNLHTSSADPAQTGFPPSSCLATADRRPYHHGNSPSCEDSTEIGISSGRPRWPWLPAFDLQRRTTKDSDDGGQAGTDNNTHFLCVCL